MILQAVTIILCGALLVEMKTVHLDRQHRLFTDAIINQKNPDALPYSWHSGIRHHSANADRKSACSAADDRLHPEKPADVSSEDRRLQRTSDFRNNIPKPACAA